MGIRLRLRRAFFALFYVLLATLSLMSAAGCNDSENSQQKQACGNGGEPCEAVRGCTDPTALNYNASATEDDGNCT
ncbi:TPA: hypothetical protein EYO57_00895, partial [Candidatus Poribacteria bacterium]|nr:hypothetical protein [Candidatus Poribacteria bacterium]